MKDLYDDGAVCFGWWEVAAVQKDTNGALIYFKGGSSLFLHQPYEQMAALWKTHNYPGLSEK